MRPILMFFLALPDLFTAGWMLAETPKQDAPSPRAQYQALVDDRQKALEEFRRLYDQAKTEAEKERIRKEKSPYGQEYSERFLALAEKYSKDPVAVDAANWVLRYASGDDYEKTLRMEERAVALLLRDHLADERITAQFYLMVYHVNPAFEKFFHALVERSPNRIVRARACFHLGRELKMRARRVRGLQTEQKAVRGYETSYGKKIVKWLLESDPKALERDAERQFAEVIAKYGDVTEGRHSTLGEQARAELFELRHLAIGKTAPDIEGEDIDGKRFKLSDYRGKVVLLDFWGHW